MEWIRIGDYFEQAENGCRVAAARVDGQWRFSAFAPPLTDTQFEARLKAHYARGESIPQQRELIGCFSQAREARQACEEHHNRVTPPDGG